jgi:hypothetical protein
MAQQPITQQTQQYGQNYMLLLSSITTGMPVIERVDPSGFITIEFQSTEMAGGFFKLNICVLANPLPLPPHQSVRLLPCLPGHAAPRTPLWAISLTKAII